MEHSIVSASSDEALRKGILTDDSLQTLQALYPGYIRVLSIRRRRVTLVVHGVEVTFEVFDHAPEGLRLFTWSSPSPAEVDGFPEGLKRLMWHSAGEAILALRKGYVDYAKEHPAAKPKARQKVAARL